MRWTRSTRWWVGPQAAGSSSLELFVALLLPAGGAPPQACVQPAQAGSAAGSPRPSLRCETLSRTHRLLPRFLAALPANRWACRWAWWA